MLCPSRTYTYVISPAAVDLEACQIEAALRRGGYDPSGLDFSQQASQRVVDDAVRALSRIGVEVVRRVWDRMPDGGAQVAVELAREADVGAAALTLR